MTEGVLRRFARVTPSVSFADSSLGEGAFVRAAGTGEDGAPGSSRPTAYVPRRTKPPFHKGGGPPPKAGVEGFLRSTTARRNPPAASRPSPLWQGGLSPAGGTPSQSASRLTAPPKGELGEHFRKDSYLPLWGRWRGEAVTERALRGHTSKKQEVFYESNNQLQSLPMGG